MVQYIDQELRDLFDGGALFEQVSGIEGEVFRSLENRRTVCFERAGERYFAKTHFGIGWREIVKNLSQFRLPVLGAENEFRALNALSRLGIDSLQPVAYFSEGLNPARRRSCIVTRSLENTASLEDLFESRSLSTAQKRILIPKLAEIARRMHANGINHRDFYLCHFLLDVTQSELSPFLIDLHRAQIRKRTPLRWRVKDVGGLFFSSFDYGITCRDVYRFMTHYSGKPLRETLDTDGEFWKAVYGRARQLYKQDHSDIPAWVKQMEARS